MGRKEIISLLEGLEEEGGKFYHSNAKINKWEKIGMAISSCYPFEYDMIDIVSAIAEDWNFHGFCSILNSIKNKQTI